MDPTAGCDCPGRCAGPTATGGGSGLLQSALLWQDLPPEVPLLQKEVSAGQASHWLDGDDHCYSPGLHCNALVHRYKLSEQTLLIAFSVPTIFLFLSNQQATNTVDTFEDSVTNSNAYNSKFQSIQSLLTLKTLLNL